MLDLLFNIDNRLFKNGEKLKCNDIYFRMMYDKLFSTNCDTKDVKIMDIINDWLLYNNK